MELTGSKADLSTGHVGDSTLMAGCAPCSPAPSKGRVLLTNKQIVSTVQTMKETKRAKILGVAKAVFLRYGYRRVSMSDIAEAAGISRAALYLVFNNKEDIFAGVFLQWVDETLAEIHDEMARLPTPEQKLRCAFDVWAVRPFEMVKDSPEAKDLIECSLAFAQPSLRKGYKQFEATIAPVLAALYRERPAAAHMPPDRIAHVLASAVRGFKQTATTAAELRELVRELLMACFGSSTAQAARPARDPVVRRRSGRLTL